MSSAKKKTNDFLVQGSILAAASIISRFIGILYRIPVTNIVGDAGVADYSNAFEIYNIVLILSSFSLPLSVSKLVSARTEKKEYVNSYRLFLCAMAFAVCTGTVFTLVLYFGSDFFASVVFNMPSSAIPLRVLAPTIFISAIMGVLRGFYQGKKTMIPTALSQVLEQVVNAVVSVVASIWFMKAYSTSPDQSAYGAAGSTLGTFLGSVAALLFLGFIFVLYKPTIRKQMRRDRHEYYESYRGIFRILLLTILPVVLSQTVYQVSGIIDNGLFGHIMEFKGVAHDTWKEMLGVYSGKYRLLSNLPIAIASALASSMIPAIVSSFMRADHYDLKEKIRAAIHFNMIIAFPCAVGMTVLADPIIQLLFSGSGPLAANLLRMGSVAIIFYALSTVSNAILQGISRMDIPVLHAGISLGIHVLIVFMCLFVFDLGIYGMVIGNVSFAFVVCVLNWRSIAKILDYKQEVKKSFILPAICSLIMGAFTWIFYMLMYLATNSNIVSTLAALCVAVVVYFVALMALRAVETEDLYGFPMGRTLIQIGTKLHLLDE